MSSVVVMEADSTSNEIDEELLSYEPGIDLFVLEGQVFDTDVDVMNEKTEEAYSPVNENLVVDVQFEKTFSKNNEEEEDEHEAFHGFHTDEIHPFLQNRTHSINKQISLIKNAQGLAKEDYEFQFHGFSIEELNKKLEEITKFRQKITHLLRKQMANDEECELDSKLDQNSFQDESSPNTDDEDVFHGYQSQEIKESLYKRYNSINNQIDLMENDGGNDKIECYGISIEELKEKREFILGLSAQYMKMKIAKEFDSRPYDIAGYIKYLMETSILEDVIKEVLKRDLMKKMINLVDKCFDDWWNKNNNDKD